MQAAIVQHLLEGPSYAPFEENIICDEWTHSYLNIRAKQLRKH